MSTVSVIVFAVDAEAVSGSVSAVALCIEWLASSWAAVIVVRAGNNIGDAGEKVLMSLSRRNQCVSALIAGV